MYAEKNGIMTKTTGTDSAQNTDID